MMRSSSSKSPVSLIGKPAQQTASAPSSSSTRPQPRRTDMAYITRITVTNDNDPSCRTYTLTEEINSVDPPKPSLIKTDIKTLHERFRSSLPHNHNLPVFLPTEVEIVPAQNREMEAA